MAAPKFQKTGYSDLELTKVVFGLDRPQRRVQVMDRTAGGTLQVEDLGITIKTRVLPMRKLTDTEIAALRTWHETNLTGAYETFTFVDEDETSHTARWIDDTLSAPETREGRHDATVTLEIVSTP